MRQGGVILRIAPFALALALVAPPAFAAARAAHPAAAATPKVAKARNSLRQFTGYVTAMEKSGFTVEKRGKNARTIVFVKDAEMKTVGDVAKDARVTVYYRDEGGQTVAHRVVVKSGAAGATSRR